MQIKQKIVGLLIIFGINVFAHSQQNNQSPECLNQANEYKNSVYILIDPGHGCTSNNGLACLPSGQPGAVDDPNNVTYSEACMTTDLALRIRDILQGLGLDVGMTRNTNFVQTPTQKAFQIRTQISNAKVNKGNNLKPYFISIHFNGGSSTANGNFGIYAYSNRNGESVANFVSNAQNTLYLSNQGQPVLNTFPQVTLIDNQNNLFESLQRNIRFVLGGDYGTNTILYDDDGTDTCPARQSYKSLGIFRLGLFPLLSRWYAQSYSLCDPEHFSGAFTSIELPNTESIPVNHSLQEVEFISSPSFLRYLKRRQFVAIAMAWAITEDVVNEYINGGRNADCMRASMYSDSPDDNNSSSSGIGSGIAHIGYNSQILLPFEFINRDIIGLLNKVGAPPAVTFKEFSSTMVEGHPIFIIPTGLLAKIENDSTFKVYLEQYVKDGGTILVLGQQYGSHVDNVVPVPEGESLHTYGWREDQSCTANATYMASMHPALASQSTRTVAAAVDGYFDIYPSTATVLLRKTANQEPVLLHYPYGQGTVILTSMYTDWGAAHSQASTSELRLVRDLITFAKKPNLTIPMHRLTQTEPVQINLALKIRNDSEFLAAKAKIKALSPDRKIVLYESEQPLTLTAGAEGDMPISFSVAYTSAVLYGICHVDYELYDAGGNLLQMMSEADTGRFALYPIEINTNTPAQKAAWLTVDTEEAIYGMPITFTLHVSNPTDKVIEGSFCYSWGHDPCFNSFFLSIPAGQTIEKKIEVNYFYYEMYGRFRVFGPEGLYANKGIRFVSPQTKSNVSMIGPTALKVGTPFQYSIRSLNQFPQAMDVNLVLKLMKWTKGQVEDNGYATVATLLDTTGHLEKGGSYQNSGSYTPEQFVFSGYYMLRLEVTTPDRVRAIYYSPHFSYIRSSVSIGVQPLAGAIEAGYQTISKILIPGNEYPFQFNIANRSAFAIDNGKYSVVVSTEQGQEAFRKEIEGLIFTTGEAKSLTENIDFLPPLPGIYYIKVLYSDETGTAYNVKSGAYYSGFNSHVSTQQSSIRYGETLRVNIALQGAGTYIINAITKDEGFFQEKTVQLSEENNFSTTEFFDIPALLENYFKSGPIGQNLQVLVAISNTSAYCEGIPSSRICRDSDLISVKRVPLVVNASGTFSTLSAHVGDPLEFTFNMVGTSGFVAPLNGELRVQAPGLAFNETRVVAISPTGNNGFVFSIPLSSTIAAGQYEVTADIIIIGRSIYSDNYAIQISAPGMKFSTLPPAINAGSELPLNFINDGGKDGVYDIQIIVNDAMGRQVAALGHENIGIAAGAFHHEALALPVELKSGQYFLQQEVNEKQTGVTTSDRGGFSVSGQSLELQAYTLKEKYFDNEPITAKADLTPGGNGAEGRLQARAVRLSEKEVSVDTITPGDYGTVNSGFSGAKGYNGKLYFASGSPATLKSYDLATGEVSDLLIQCGGGFKISEDGAFVYAIYFGYSSMPTRIFEVNLATREKREISCPSDAQYANDIFRSSTGEYWFWRSSESWIYRRGVDGSFTKYTWTKSSLSSIYQIYQVKENKIGGYSGIWIGTETGVMAFRNGVFSRYYVSLYYIYYCGLDVDSSGDVRFAYRTTTDGYHLKKFNGTGLVEEALPFPGNTGYEYPLPFSLNDGSFWLFRSSSQTLYRQQNGVWQERPLTAVDPSVHSAEFMQNMTSGGDFWLTGLVTDPATNNEVNALFHYSAATDQFEKFTASEHRYLQNEVSGITAYNHPPCFSLGFGFLEFQSGSFRYHELAQDQDRLMGTPQCMLADAQGKLYAGSTYGISVFDGNSWQNFVYANTGDRLYEILSLAKDHNGSIYAASYYYGDGGIFKITRDQTTRIAYPEDTAEWNFSLDYSSEPRKLTVDTQGRLWLLGNYLYYYDGTWHNYSYQKFTTTAGAVVSDRNGGVWVSENNLKKVDGFDASGLIHVKADLSYAEFTSANSGLPVGVWIDSIFIDSRGKLWIINRNGYYLMSYDGQNWVDYNIFSGYPAGGIFDVGEDRSGNLFFNGIAQIGDNSGGGGIELAYARENRIASVEEGWKSGFYKLDGDAFNNIFTLPGKIMGYPFENAAGSFFFRGTMGVSGGGETVAAKQSLNDASGTVNLNFENNNLYKISNDAFAGMYAKEVWRKSYPVDLEGGASTVIDMDIPAITATGNFMLEAEMHNSLNQVMARSEHPFTVRSSTVHTGLERAVGAGIFVRANTDLTIHNESLNNTQENLPGLAVQVSMTGPSGEQFLLRDEALPLNARQENEWNFVFNQSDIGAYMLTAELREGDTIISSNDMMLEIAEPIVAYEITVPPYAGDEAFPVKVNLTNPGKIPANVHVQVLAYLSEEDETGIPKIDEDVLLLPGEARILSFTDAIKSYGDYEFSFSGDLEAAEWRGISYGYVGNLALNVLPQYREGTVSMGYTMANGGGLAFSDTIHFGLYLMGTDAALHAVDKTYNLYPGAEAIAEALEFPLAPGAYQLRWTSGHSGSGQNNFSVLPAGIGQLAFAPAPKYPIGLTEFSYALSNSDTVAGSIDLLIEIVPAAGGAAVYSLNRSHYLEPGTIISDTFGCDFAGIGSYIVRVSGAKVSGETVSVPVKVLNLDEVTTSVVVQPTSDGTIPVQVQVANNGFNNFAGTLVTEAGGLSHEEPLQVLSEATLNQTFAFDANGLSSGSHEVNAIIYDVAGNMLSQNVLTVVVANADIKVNEVLQNLTIAAGSFAAVSITVRNNGNKRGEAEIALTAFDNLNETRTLTLEAGEELELSELFIDVDADIPAGRYPLNYVLSGPGVANGLAKGNFTFQVTGIALDVQASLDRSLYNQGETAQLTIDISSVNPVTAPLEAVVNWNDFSERRPFTLDSGSSSLVFEIPLAEVSDAKVFYGIYQQEGRGIYLNDIYLNFAGGVSVTLDQQVYAPGDSIHALFAVGEAGSLTAECFGQSQTIAIGTSGSINFAVPADALGGSYGISWTFTPTDASHETLSGAKPFDVSGLVVKVAKAELERGKYAPGDIIKAMLNLESNRDIILSLRSWTVTPEAAWTYLGEQNVSLSATQQTPAIMQYTFATSEAGTHRFVYGLYNGEQLVVSGAAAFDCGDAVLIGLACDRLEYPLGSETVKIRIDHFGSGTATLQLYLDDVPVETRSITLSGLGNTQIDLAAAQVSGGRHDLRGVISKDGLTSMRRAWFTYGTSLPDLAVGIGERAVNGLDYVFNVQVFNSGKTNSPATALVFSDNGTDMQSAAIGALAPGAWQDAQFSWSGSGKAGSHALTFTVDRDNAVKEFAEANNILEMNEEVPALFYRLAIDPQVWTANRSVSIFSHFINNQSGDLPLALHLTLTHNLSSQVVLARDKDVTLSPFVQTLETDLFQTGTYPAGDYTLAQTASGGSVERTEELAVYIEPTKAISGIMSAVPATVAAGIDAQVTLKLALSNNGNIALDNETLSIEVAGNESQQVVKTEMLSVALAIGENKAIDHILTLNLAEGIYVVTLKFSEETIAETEIAASMGLEKEKTVSRRPRLLLMNTHAFTFNSQKNFLKAVLNAAGISYQDSGNLIESYFHDQKSEHNINVVFGKLATQSLKNELKERVHRGEGLIHIVDNPASDAVMEELSGVKAHNLLPALREREITLLPGVLGGGGTALLKDKCKLGLEMLVDDVLAVAETRNGKKPLAAYRPYGNGKVLTISLPLEFTSGGGFAQLLLNAVQLLNNDVFSPSDLSRVLPLELRIKNNTGAAKTFRVQELIPQAAAGYGFNPQPLAGVGVKWDIQLAVDEEKTISYWLRLPDAIGIFDVKSEIFEGAKKVDETLLTFEVGQKIADRAAGIAAEIAAVGDDQSKKALPMLQRIAGRSSEDPVSLWLNLVDAVWAADLVAASGTAEAMAWRQGLQDLLMACACVFYDKVKDFTLLELNAFGTRFAE